MKFRLFMSGLLLAGLMSSPASAQLASFDTDFTSTGTAYPSADTLTIGDGWKYFATQPPNGPYMGDAPNGPQMSAMADDGVPSPDTNSYINVYADYNNAGLATTTTPFTVSVFQEQTFTSADTAGGATWTLDFDYKHADGGGPSGATTTRAFIRVIEAGTFNLLDEKFFDTTTLNGNFPGFDPGSVSLTLSPAWTAGGFVQFGFENSAGGWSPGTPDGSGVFYDNVEFTPNSLAPFCTDFEDYAIGPEFAPLEDNWLYFHTNGAFDSYGGPANVNGPQISKLADEDGDPGTAADAAGDPEVGGGGNKYLNIYSDYNNPLTVDLTNNVFQQQSFTAADAALAETWTFHFDYAKGAAPFGVGDVGAATTEAFIKVFDGAFNPLEFSPGVPAVVTFDTTSTTTAFASGSISMTMVPGWTSGGIVQFGFASTRNGAFVPAPDDETTGVYYDNVDWANFVRGDADDNGTVNSFDIASFGTALFMRPAYDLLFPGVNADEQLDMNCDGVLNNFDIPGFGEALGF